ncbi:Ctr-domain-containing protein [Byssothecium circinans]|uniref:Copper transport protein n=1 Tax=Byssothecium circinans TaxID=147558 RepID=A0A6A5UHK5_9PLEO|nr:Ctr-domain-containing protein [Byssothecium circinans]
MDHSHMSKGSAISTGTAATSSSTTSSHAGMDMGGGGNSCKISMLWNWNTIDSCFLSRSWHITSKGMFAGSCIGVMLLVILLEFLRRSGKEYDRYILSQYCRSLAPQPTAPEPVTPKQTAPEQAASEPIAPSAPGGNKVPTTSATPAAAWRPAPRFRPNVLQQSIRALLHMCQFAVAYFVMLLAMYYNGYIIICIFIGAYLGYFIFGWESFRVNQGANDRLEEEVTVCCG